MTFSILPFAGVGQLDTWHSPTQPEAPPLGSIVQGSDGAFYQLVKYTGGTSNVPSRWSTISRAYEGALATDNGVASRMGLGVQGTWMTVSDPLSTNDYHFIQRTGAATGAFLANCAANVDLYASDTAGYLDDAVATFRRVYGVNLDSAIGGSDATAACNIDWPHVDNTTS